MSECNEPLIIPFFYRSVVAADFCLTLEESDGHGDRHDDVLEPLRLCMRNLGVHANEGVSDLAVVVAVEFVWFAMVCNLVFISPDGAVGSGKVHEPPHQTVDRRGMTDRTVVAHVHQESHTTRENAQRQCPWPASIYANLVDGIEVHQHGEDGLGNSEGVISVAGDTLARDQFVHPRAHVDEESIVRTGVGRQRLRWSGGRLTRLVQGGQGADVLSLAQQSGLHTRDGSSRVVGLHQTRAIAAEQIQDRMEARDRKHISNPRKQRPAILPSELRSQTMHACLRTVLPRV